MRQHRGVAIITVLLIVTLVSVLATTMSGRLQSQISRVLAAEEAEQAWWHFLSAEALARQVLLLELEEEDDDRVHLAQNWAEQQGPFPVEGGQIGGRIRDLQGCFNLNTLFRDDDDTAAFARAIEQYQALLELLDFDSFSQQQLTSTLVDWLDRDTQLHDSYGAEDADYESMPQPYQAANTLLSHISELRTVQGYTAEVYEQLRPYVCAIPGVTEWSLNMNTVPAERPEIVAAFFRGAIDPGAAMNIIQARPEDGFADTDDIRELSELQNLLDDDEEGPVELNQIVVTSEYFELHAQVRYGELEFYGTSKLRIAEGAAWTLHRSRGGYRQHD